MGRVYLIDKKMINDPETFTKKDLSRIVAKISGTNMLYARNMINNVLFAITQIIVEMNPGDSLELRDFGVFQMSYNKAGDNFRAPKTNEKVIKPAKRRIIWQPSKKIKRELVKI